MEMLMLIFWKRYIHVAVLVSSTLYVTPRFIQPTDLCVVNTIGPVLIAQFSYCGCLFLANLKNCVCT